MPPLPKVVSSDKSLTLNFTSAASFVALDEALARLAEFDERKCKIVELRFFVG
jgi:hypothetical protein